MRDRPRLDRRERIRAGLEVAGASAEPGERRIERDVGTIIGRVVVAPVAVGLPQLDERVLDVLAIAVEHPTFDADAFADGLGCRQHVLALGRQSHREVRPDGLRWRLAVMHATVAVTVWPRCRAARCPIDNRAPSSRS